ncbi:hypothetical protein [Mucilaginibacter rubeus]|uniref:Uncharacterized protein n=1 Tax=Mucilaginibacter rubeus TaxID=2027860 RepID=A0A5C1HT38_9SPHI|nr:hypothetical protein [Mucilaginibacter rubeus]QEM09042.1 hypothetical protein DEO27_003090 [Mucilaginibacter rubeus]
MEQDQEKTPVTEKTLEKEETPASAQKVAGLQSNSETPVSNAPINTNEVASATGNTDDKSKEVSKESPAGKVTASNGEIVSKETSSNSESRKLRSNAVPLWEKLNSACHDIEVDEHSNYYWPEERTHTNNIIRQLKEKRILFIRSFTENWSFRALQRLATVMHAENEGGNLIIRINTGEDLDFGFWINERPLPYPVVIIMPVHRYDFFQKFTQNAQYVMNTQLPELRRLNLHIVCQIQTTTTVSERFPGGDHWMKQTYAFWDIPVVKLELTSKFGVRGQATFEQIQDKIEKYGEHAVGWELVKRSYANPEDVKEQLDKHIEESAQEIRQRKEALINILDGTDFTPKLLVFCASFFSGLHYRDFTELVTQLLKYEQVNQQYIATDQAVTAEPKLTLGQLWEKNADQYLPACSIKTVWKDGNHQVEFAFRGLADIMSAYITNERYPFFYRVYRNFENAKLITNLNLSKDLEKSLINLFAKAARMDTQNYSAEWLKNEVCTLWEEYSKEMPEQIDSYEDLFSYLYDKKFFGEMLLKRVPLIINGLLTENDADYREIIKEFFRLLLNEPHARRIAIIIASDLYKKFKGTDTFSTEDLMDYFRKTLEGNNSWDDRFFAYDALRDCMEAEAMRQQSAFSDILGCIKVQVPMSCGTKWTEMSFHKPLWHW